MGQSVSDHLIDGRIKETGETTIYTPRSTEKEIPLFAASSMVNEIAPILKALTNSKETGFIFYDELEISLHPLKQIEMAKLTKQKQYWDWKMKIKGNWIKEGKPLERGKLYTVRRNRKIIIRRKRNS